MQHPKKFSELIPLEDSLGYIVVPYHKVVGLLVVDKVLDKSRNNSMVYLECVVPVHVEQAVPNLVKKVISAYPDQWVKTKVFHLPVDGWEAILMEMPPTKVSTSESHLKDFMLNPQSVSKILKM